MLFTTASAQARLAGAVKRVAGPAALVVVTTTTTVAATYGSERASVVATNRMISTTTTQCQRALFSHLQTQVQTPSRSLVKTRALSLSSPNHHRYHQQQYARYFSSSSSSTKTDAAATAAATTATTTATKTAPAAAAATAAPAKGGFSFVQWYEGHLQARPVQTKMVTGSLLWGLGDAVAQIVPTLAFGKDKDDKESADATAADYDWPRTGRAAFFGFALHAPLSHLHYNFLEWMTVRGGYTGLQIPLFKAFMEQFVYWSWFSNSLYHGAMGAMQGQGPQQIYDRIADVLWETQKAQWVFWIPVQLLNFQFIPVRHQLNVVLVTSIVWTALLSAWYPPQDQEQKKTKKEETKALPSDS